ncbi:hypothetical protein FRC0104_02394 [Corynebacterium diphtheriae]|nr:hypothetical protein FRC0104_02394 [Corynebacterium diphtheriae]
MSRPINPGAPTSKKADLTDEFQFRQTATDLFYRYARLDQAKTTATPSPEIKNSGGAFGPKPPGNTAAVDLDHDLCTELYEMVCNAIEEIQPTVIMHKHGPRMAAWLRWHADECTRLDWADDLHDLMCNHIHRIDRLINPVELSEIIGRDEPWQLGTVIIDQLNQLGHRYVVEDLYTWAYRGHIRTRKRAARATYLLSEVVNYLETRQLTE